MNLFDRKIAEKLANAPRHAPDDEVWKRVADVRGLAMGSDISAWWYGLAIAVFLLSTAGSFWLGRNSVTKEASSDSQDLGANSKIVEVATKIIDTIFIRDTVLQYVYRNRKDKDEVFTSAFSDFGTSTLLHRFNFKPGIDHSFLDSYFYADKSNGRLTSSGIADKSWTAIARSYQNKRTLADSVFSDKLWSTFSPLAGRNLGKISDKTREISLHPYRALAAEDIIRIERKRRFFKSLIPDTHRIGPVIGAFNPVKYEVEHANEWIAGVEYEMAFSQKLSLIAGFRYRYFSGKNEHELEGSKFPLPDGLLPGDEIHEIYVTNQYIDIPLIFRYSMVVPARLTPFVQGGLLLSSARSQDFKYEIRRNGEEFKLSSGLGKRPIMLNSLVAGLGLSYRLFPRVVTDLGIEGRYNYSISSLEISKSHGVGMRFRLLYDL